MSEADKTRAPFWAAVLFLVAGLVTTLLSFRYTALNGWDSLLLGVGFSFLARCGDAVLAFLPLPPRWRRPFVLVFAGILVVGGVLTLLSQWTEAGRLA